jgi:hypothetical protein
MRRFRRREIRKIRQLAKALAVLDEQAALARPTRRREQRTRFGFSGIR